MSANTAPSIGRLIRVFLLLVATRATHSKQAVHVWDGPVELTADDIDPETLQAPLKE